MRSVTLGPTVRARVAGIRIFDSELKGVRSDNGSRSDRWNSELESDMKDASIDALKIERLEELQRQESDEREFSVHLAPQTDDSDITLATELVLT